MLGIVAGLGCYPLAHSRGDYLYSILNTRCSQSPFSRKLNDKTRLINNNTSGPLLSALRQNNFAIQGVRIGRKTQEKIITLFLLTIESIAYISIVNRFQTLKIQI